MDAKALVLLGIGVAIIGFAAVLVTIIIPVITPMLEVLAAF